MSSLRQGPPARLLPAARPARNGRALRLLPLKLSTFFLQWGKTPLRPEGAVKHKMTCRPQESQEGNPEVTKYGIIRA